MTISTLFDYVDEIKPNAFSDATKLVWVNEVEGMIQSQIMLRAESACVEHSSTNENLLVGQPYSKMYAEYIMARIDYANGEYDKYQNTMQMFNEFWEEYKTWYQRVYRPTPTRGYTTVQMLFDYVDEVKPNNVASNTKLVWLNEVEGLVQTQIMLRSEDECTEHTAANEDLLIGPPYNNFYADFIMAKIDSLNNDEQQNQAAMEQFSQHFSVCTTWYNRVYRPTAYRGYRTIQSVFDYVDEVKPNAAASALKMVWLNEIEGKVQTEIFLWNEAECFVYNYTYSGSASVFFPDEHTMAFSDPSLLREFRPGGIIRSFSPGSPYAANAFTARKIQKISEVGLVFAESFPATGETAISTTITYDGSTAELLVEPPHNKIYANYIIAQIEYFSGDMDKYTAAMTRFADSWGEFSRWFARVYCPAGRRR